MFARRAATSTRTVGRRAYVRATTVLAPTGTRRRCRVWCAGSGATSLYYYGCRCVVHVVNDTRSVCGTAVQRLPTRSMRILHVDLSSSTGGTTQLRTSPVQLYC